MKAIYADLLLQELKIGDSCETCTRHVDNKCKGHLQWLCRRIQKAPAVDTVRHGEWLNTSEGEPYCSICGKVTQDMEDVVSEIEEDLTDRDGNVLAKKGTRCFALQYPSYCSRCGAKMDGRRIEDEPNN